MSTPQLLLAAACMLTAAAAVQPSAAAVANAGPTADDHRHQIQTLGSAHHMRSLAQSAPAASAPSSATGAPPGAASSTSGGAPNTTQLAGMIVGSFNASTDNTTKVADTPGAQQNVSTSGVSAISPEAWPLVGNWTPIVNNRWRIMGPEVLAKREQMELYYRTAIATVLDPYNITVRFLNYTTYPASDASLNQYNAVDETLHMYQYSPPVTASQPLRFNNAAAQFNLTAQTTNLARVTLTGIVQRLGIDTQLIQLWGEAIESERSQLADGKFWANESSLVQAEILSRVSLVGQGLLPFTQDKQDLFLTTAIGIANQQSLPLISLNVSSWKAAPANTTGNRKLLQTDANDQVLVDVYTLLQPVGNYTPSTLWNSILESNSVFSPTTLANGLQMSGTFQNGTSYYYTRNHTLLGSLSDPSNGVVAQIPGVNTPAPPAPGVVEAGPTNSIGTSGGLSNGAIAGIAIATAAVLVILGLLAALLWRQRHGGWHQNLVKKGAGAVESPPCGKAAAYMAGRNAGKGSPRGMLSLAGSSPSDSIGSDGSSVPSSGNRSATDAASVPGYAEVDPADIEICTKAEGEPWLLGSGAYGQVYKGLRRGVQQVAVKRLTAVTDPLLLNAIRKEISILQRVSFDRNVVQFYGACLKDAQSAMLIMEYCEGGDLRHALSADPGFGWYGAGQHIALDVARGLHFLHSSNVIHRDLKSSNILLTKEGVAKIGDVGLAKTMVSDYFSWETAVGTFAYAAPELLMGDKCSLKVDVFSFGVVLWEIVTRGHPVRGRLREVRVPDECPPAVEQLIADCVNSEVGARPTSGDVAARLLAMVQAGSDGAVGGNSADI